MNTTTFMIRLGIFLLFLFLLDLYAFQAVRTAFKSAVAAKWVYWTFSVSVWIAIIYVFSAFNRSTGFNQVFMYLMALMLLSVVPKLIVLLFMIGEDVARLIAGSIRKIGLSNAGDFLPDRRRFVSQTALVLAAIPFAGIIHGVLRGRFNFRVLKKELMFNDLPEEFDGFTITHISDIHSGSFDRPDKIKYAIDLINEQQSDLLLFTGDLVNNRASEMEPWIDIFSKLAAPMGKFSVLGNHDYGDYVEWESSAAKQANMQRLYEIHDELGFTLLRNENAELKKGDSSIRLVGVENWGTGGFSKHGDLNKASAGVPDNAFKILMSHDPSHFDHEVKKHKKFFHLTLSGHTHGMQFGIEIPGWIKWSPVKYRYPKWAGLYEDLGRYLYINRGFGFLAFPGRVGIWPEITVLTLRKQAAV